jgi:hypothetical protein
MITALLKKEIVNLEIFRIDFLILVTIQSYARLKSLTTLILAFIDAILTHCVKNK